MYDDERERLLAELIENPRERERILRDAQLSDDERGEVASLIDTADALWISAQSAPNLEDDPVAAMLGLVPDDNCRLDSGALARARKRSSLSVSDLAEQLRQRGWDFDKRDVFRWETSTAIDVPPAVVQVIAEVLSTPMDNLISASPLHDHRAAVRNDPMFQRLVTRWARARRVSRAVAVAALETRMLATVHRGERPDTEQLLRSLDALVTSVEREAQE